MILKINSKETDDFLNWFEWFDFSSDPFIITPLQSEDEFNTLFVKTESVEKELDYLISQVRSDPFTLLTIGSRGVGKSTILQYVVNLCRKNGILSIYIGLLPYGIKSSREPVYELSRQIMKSMIQELILEIFKNKNELFKKHERSLISWGKFVGLNYDSVEGFYREPVYQLEFSVLKDVLFGILELIKKNDLNVVITIDNLDKLESDIVINFLKGGTTQPLMESLNNSKVSMLIATDLRTAEIVNKDVDLSYLKRKFRILPLSPSEADNLINLRVNRYSRSKERKYYDRRAIFHICNKNEGITRDIINDARKLFEKAYEIDTKYVTYDIAIQNDIEFNERDAYYSIIKDETARKGAEKILNLVYEISEDKHYDAVKYLHAIYEGKRLRIPGNILHKFIENDIIFTEDSLSKGHRLDINIYHLLNNLPKYKWKEMDFLKWIFKVDTVNVVKIHILGSRGKIWIDKYNKIFPMLKLPEKDIIVVRNENTLKYNIIDWKDDILYKFIKLSDNYNTLTNIDIEDISTNSILHLIYIILKNYLLIFIKFISIFTDDAISFYSDTPSLDNWIYIWKGISFYQKEFNYWFITYNDIRDILQLYSTMRDEEFIPSFSEVENAVFQLEEIIIEFSNQIENVMFLNKLTEEYEQIKISSENINTIKNSLDNLGKCFGYHDEMPLEILKIKDKFIIDNEDDVKIINNNIIFIRKNVIKNKNDKERKHYLISFVNKYEKVIDSSEIILYINVIKKLIDILEEKEIILKNIYQIWIYSNGGYTENTNKIINKVKFPLRTSVELINPIILQSYLNSYSLPIISENILEYKYKDELEAEKKISHVFIIYRAGNELSEKSAKYLGKYLTNKNIKIYLFKKEISWGDSITDFEEEAINNAFASVICYTEDFKTGKTASEEYRAVLAKRRSDENFKVGLLLVNCGYEDVPPFMKDYFYVQITGPEDEKFEEQAEIIYKGLLGLPIEE